VNHQRWHDAIKQVRSELSAWGISTDHLSDHELNTAINTLSQCLSRTGLTVTEAIRAIGQLNAAMTKRPENFTA
jgi:hypothetical protein